MSGVQHNENNEELADLGTHMAGATGLHKTRTSDEVMVIEAPGQGPGIVDNRDHEKDFKKNGKSI
ncbi:hypothetical protein J2T17_007760 [Paenibacillus mucilaginosus]|uniref:hypothetical protein n=1 Tax=Paenibacillus mucilaginosus TaxID=61624 RepID=UPI003D1FBD35